ncbi:MAG: cytochrome c [Candidatus Binatia bacterium]
MGAGSKLVEGIGLANEVVLAVWKMTVSRARFTLALVAIFIIAAPVEGQTDSAEMQSIGAALHAAYCQSCHGDRNGKGTSKGASPHNEKGHTWHHPDIQLRDWILNGKPGFEAMPAFKGQLTDNDVEAILVLIKTWWTAEQWEMQADISIRFEEAFGKKRRKAP